MMQYNSEKYTFAALFSFGLFMLSVLNRACGFKNIFYTLSAPKALMGFVFFLSWIHSSRSFFVFAGPALLPYVCIVYEFQINGC